MSDGESVFSALPLREFTVVTNSSLPRIGRKIDSLSPAVRETLPGLSFIKATTPDVPEEGRRSRDGVDILRSDGVSCVDPRLF